MRGRRSPLLREGRTATPQHARQVRVSRARSHLPRRSSRLSSGDTGDCPVCAKGTCKSHFRVCSSCGRAVCVTDVNAARGRCSTCDQLRDIADPGDALVNAGRIRAEGWAAAEALARRARCHAHDCRGRPRVDAPCSGGCASWQTSRVVAICIRRWVRGSSTCVRRPASCHRSR